MKERLTSLIAGFILSLVIIIGAVYFFSRPAPVKVEPIKAIDPNSLQAIDENVGSLNNNGELPKPVNNPDIGRPNPFDDY